jgi:hypothetical protein
MDKPYVTAVLVQIKVPRQMLLVKNFIAAAFNDLAAEQHVEHWGPIFA